MSTTCSWPLPTRRGGAWVRLGARPHRAGELADRRRDLGPSHEPPAPSPWSPSSRGSTSSRPNGTSSCSRSSHTSRGGRGERFAGGVVGGRRGRRPRPRSSPSPRRWTCGGDGDPSTSTTRAGPWPGDASRGGRATGGGHDEATGEGLELGRITVWERRPPPRLAQLAGPVETEVRVEPIDGGTSVRVEARIAPDGQDRGGTSWMRVTPAWFGDTARPASRRTWAGSAWSSTTPRTGRRGPLSCGTRSARPGRTAARRRRRGPAVDRVPRRQLLGDGFRARWKPLPGRAGHARPLDLRRRPRRPPGPGRGRGGEDRGTDPPARLPDLRRPGPRGTPLDLRPGPAGQALTGGEAPSGSVLNVRNSCGPAGATLRKRRPPARGDSTEDPVRQGGDGECCPRPACATGPASHSRQQSAAGRHTIADIGRAQPEVTRPATARAGRAVSAARKTAASALSRSWSARVRRYLVCLPQARRWDGRVASR